MTKRTKRLLAYLSVLLLVVALDCWYRRWEPALEVTTLHYVIYSTATPEQTEEVGEVAEMLYRAYAGVFGSVPGFDRELFGHVASSAGCSGSRPDWGSELDATEESRRRSGRPIRDDPSGPPGGVVCLLVSGWVGLWCARPRRAAESRRGRPRSVRDLLSSRFIPG